MSLEITHQKLTKYKVFLTIKNDGKTIFADAVDLSKAAKRDECVKAITKQFPGLDAGDLEQKLLDILQILREKDSVGDNDNSGTIAQRLLSTGLECTLHRAAGGRTFIQPKGGRPLELQSRGGSARAYLRREYYRRYQTPVRDGDLTTAVETLMAMAEEREKVCVYIRVCADQRQIVVDLGLDGNSAIVIDREGARIAEDHGKLFTLIDGATAPMPVPNFEADKRAVLQAFHDLMGLSLEDSYKLFCWLVQCWQPLAPYMILYLTGGPGNGKTTTTSFLRLIGDSLGSDGARIGKSPKDVADYIAFSSCCHILATDNITYIPKELSDTTAGLATGMGSFGRKLYTNSDIHIVDKMSPQILNGISPGGIQPDVRDRMLHVSLRQRKHILSASEWWKKARALLQDITGVLAQTCHHALKNLENIPLVSEFRMADAARWIAAAQPYLTDGTVWDGLDFADIYRRSRQEDAQASINDDPVLRCFMTIVEQSGEIKGDASYILWKIEEQAEAEGVLDELKKTRQWPKNARALSVKLQGYEPLFRDVGIIHTELPRRKHLFQVNKLNGGQDDDTPI